MLSSLSLYNSISNIHRTFLFSYILLSHREWESISSGMAPEFVLLMVRLSLSLSFCVWVYVCATLCLFPITMNIRTFAAPRDREAVLLLLQDRCRAERLGCSRRRSDLHCSRHEQMGTSANPSCRCSCSQSAFRSVSFSGTTLRSDPIRFSTASPWTSSSIRIRSLTVTHYTTITADDCSPPPPPSFPASSCYWRSILGCQSSSRQMASPVTAIRSSTHTFLATGSNRFALPISASVDCGPVTVSLSCYLCLVCSRSLPCLCVCLWLRLGHVPISLSLSLTPFYYVRGCVCRGRCSSSLYALSCPHSPQKAGEVPGYRSQVRVALRSPSIHLIETPQLATVPALRLGIFISALLSSLPDNTVYTIPMLSILDLVFFFFWCAGKDREGQKRTASM
jgi:hypothetical protein